MENLKLATFARKDKDKIAKDTEQVFTIFPRLKERKSQMAGTLSGGEQQMLAVGRAYMSGRNLMLLDEPSMGLAPLLMLSMFEALKKKYPAKNKLYIRNIGSTLVSQLIDTIIFVPIAFLGIFPNEVVWDILWTTYVIKLIVAILDTPFVYLIRSIKPFNLLNEK